ncbi:MAG: DUF3299 domain-containing protein [Planctomycetes bacterium]|nr:DUF3299 domain-containing protein [Planctomycetota bacterium]
MQRALIMFVAGWVLCTPNAALGGLYYSGEAFAELPAQWRGFLLEQRTLRNIAVKGTAKSPESLARTQYLAEAAKLEKAARMRKLSADESADLGAIYIRLGEINKALAVLQLAQREHPNHFHLAANLGTAWQLRGDLPQALVHLEQAVRLAPGKFLQAEECHLKLVRLRQKQKGSLVLDDLFGVRFRNDKGDYEPGKLADIERKKLPAKALAVAQKLALWLPGDPLLLWQLAELANAHGDVQNAAAMFDGCVIQFGLDNRDLRRHRQVVREAADDLAKLAGKEAHETKHTGTIAFRSKRPLITRLDTAPLPPISVTEVNAVPWEVFAETALSSGKFNPRFSKYLQELDGKEIVLTGFMQPLRDAGEMASFLFLESPVGCWYCEMPDSTGIIHVEMPEGKAASYQRNVVRVVGRLSLNRSDPEDFLYTLRNARVSGVD